MHWQKSHHSGQIIDQITKANHAVGDFAQDGFEILQLLTKYFGSVCFLYWLMPIAGISVGISTGFVILVVVTFDRRLIPQYSAINKQYNEVAATIQDYLTNISTVISLRLESRVAKEIKERALKVYALFKKNVILNELKWLTTGVMVRSTQTLALTWYLFTNINSGTAIEIGTLYALWEYVRNVGESFFNFTRKYGDIVVKSTQLRAIEYIDEAYHNEVEVTMEAALPADWRRLEIQNLNFIHKEITETSEAKAEQEAEADVVKELAENKKAVSIQDVSLTLERGKSYAFIGESGCGKSTTLGLIRGIHIADSAKVICDGEKLPHGLVHVSHTTTLIPQDPEIFSDTIRFNVTMNISATEAEIMQALYTARFESVLERLPKGLDTNIAEKGINLSGGEKQRLALARGIFFAKDSDIILLDEPTSSVDQKNEQQIYETLLQTYKDRCVVSSVHKLHLLKLFDEVLVFEEGRVVERRHNKIFA